eukprot:TRINITY_DN40425_c0_g1_i1.p1 TRINITY_DN40425_c0_g1~~TRINITY_DN40425_c0_g1_i1.p1  ORF type:complete len:259 (-),score=15.02 TRINITY_DN40425_c0_g1_i1:127-903(-)
MTHVEQDAVPPGHRIGACKSCGEDIGDRQTAVHALGNDYHPDCFLCSACQNPIERSYVDAGGRPFHRDCAPAAETPMCAGCKQPLDAQSVSACRQLWHPDCLRCAACKGLINSEFVNASGMPFHSRCHVGSGQSACATCSEAITAGSAVLAFGRAYHPDCFLCADCKMPIREGTYRDADGEPMHNACCRAGVTVPECPACGRSVAGSDATDCLDGTYHLGCLKCCECDGEIRFGEGIIEDPQEKTVSHSACRRRAAVA